MIVHEHDVIRSGFRLMLGGLDDVERCIGIRTLPEARWVWRRHEPHVALVDVHVAGSSGFELTRHLRADRASGRVLLMSQTASVSSRAASAVGASGFVPIGLPTAQMIEAIRTVACGAELLRTPVPSLTGLSAREQEVVELIATGATNLEIARCLHLSPNTVKGHTRTLYRKLRARNRAEAVQLAQRQGLI